MKNSIILLLLTFLCQVAFGQELVVQSHEKGLYLTHTVSPRESFYSIGRLYNLAPKDIAAFNAVDMNNGLSIGQALMIPLSNANFSQESEKGLPVYYVVGEKEGLYRVSMNNNKVLMTHLRKWNNLTSDNLNTGQKLIVGFINAPELSAYKPYTTPSDVTQGVNETKTVVQETGAQQTGEGRITQPNIKVITPPTDGILYDSNGGYFKEQFEHQAKEAPSKKEQTATAGIFKTASGWQDTKYYALMDGVEPGTIVRIVNPSNNRAVYAKILGAMSGIRQNAGLDVRISNAAASVLSIGDTEKFIVKVHY